MDSPQRSKKKRRKEKKRRKRSSSSSSSDSTEWIEATLATSSKVNKNDSTPETAEERDEWMSAPVEFSGFTRDELRKKREPKEDSSKYMLDCLGQTDRELNPYWKDGGSGLPQVVKDLSVSDSAFGDHGVEWLKKALRRAKEQAADEGRRLEDVVAERWGSLEKLESMIKDAENRADKKEKSYDKSYRDKSSYDKYKYKDRESSRYKSEGDRDRDYKKSGYSKYENFSKDQRSVRKTFMKPSDDDDDDSGYRERERKRESDYKKRHSEEYDKKNLSNKKFMKPSDDDKSSYDRSRPSSSSQSGRGWRKHPPPKQDAKDKEEESRNEDDKIELKPNENIENKREETDSSSVPVYLSADERNELAAKLVKAEILGNMELVNKLKSRLEQARSAAADAENTVVLTRTDSKGFTQPLSLAAEPEHSRRRKEKTQTHEGGKRVRYFADDDKYSLKQMFEREKRSTVEDQNEMFARLASKNVGRDESANDMDDVFEEMVRVKESDGKTAARERNRAIDEHRRSVQALDNCQWCLDGKRLLKHLVVTIGSKVYLCVPPYDSLTTGHCLLIPNQHAPCSTQLDEEVWEEIMVFRKALVKMFLSKDMDVIFFESAMSFARMPHMMWHCIPVPKESGDLAPIYFKKAILECETEWAINKKLVELSQKSLRRAIPRGLPYFAVDFGLQPGFAHVIEDEKAFPNHFAQEIIGGMLDSDICLWRKPRLQKFNEQREKVMEFITWWKPFNCIKKEKT